MSRIQTISDGYINLTKTKWSNDDVNEDDFLKEGDILLSHINSIDHLAKTALFSNINEKIIHGINLIRLRPNMELIDPLFAIRIFKSDKFINTARSFAQKAVNQASIKISDIKTINIPLPPLEIQQEIVAEIEGYQKVIDGARQVVDNWKPQVEVDPEWPVVKLGDVCEINPKKSEVSSLAKDTVVSFLPMEDIGTTQNIYPKKERLLSEIYKGYSYFQDNDVLVAKVTPCFENGKSGIARKLKMGIGFGSTEIHVIRPSEKILPEYIYPYISSKSFLTNGKTKMTGTGGLQRLPVQFIFEFEIPLPPLNTQQEIVAGIEADRKIIDGCRELIVKYEERIEKVVDGVWGDGHDNN